MKKTVTIMLAVMLGAFVAQAQTTSDNIVGYGKVNAVGGELTLVALNFDTGGLALNDLFSDLPSGSAIHVWDKASGAYVSSNKGRAGFSPNTILSVGDAFWIQAGGSGTTEIVLPGEVNTDAVNSTTIAAGIEATGYFYPVAVAFGDTDLASTLPSGSTIHIWDDSTSSYKSYNKGRAGWGTGATEVIGVSQGFWVQAPSSVSWDETRPFDF